MQSGLKGGLIQVRNAFDHSVQNLSPSHLLHKNMNIKIKNTIILPALLYGCGTWCHLIKGVFENRVLRDRFWPTNEVTGEWKKFHSEFFMVYRSTLLYILLEWSNVRWRCTSGVWSATEGKWVQDIIKMGLQELVCEFVAWFHLM
jgi:hypothetical protein